MSSPCLSGGGGRAYSFDLDIVKSSPSSTITTSSTLSESSNNTNLSISTRKSRTPRKRPNQTFNEATVLLSTVYPNVFSTKHLTNPRKFKPNSNSLFDNSSGFLLIPEKPTSHYHMQSKSTNLIWSPSPVEVDFRPNSLEVEMEMEAESFDAESILDEEIEEGIDSIMGNLSVENLEAMNLKPRQDWNLNLNLNLNCYRNQNHSMGMRAIREVNDGNNWWCFPTVDVVEISPKLSKQPLPPPPTATVKKKKKKVEKLAVIEMKKEKQIQKPSQNQNPILKSGLILKLNYEAVLNAWSDKGSPFSDEILGSDAAENDVNARLANIDLFSEGGGLREASVLRYKEKRRTRLFSKKIRYQVRKVNADGRPRMKGRFVRSPNSSSKGHSHR